MYRLLLLVLLLSSANTLEAFVPGAQDVLICKEEGYVRPATCPEEAWDLLAPYFLPYQHSLRKQLDKIFTKPKALSSSQHLKKLGFHFLQKAKEKRICVMKHPKIPGCLFKAYMDKQGEVDDPVKLFIRITGASLVQSTIDHYQFGSFVKVPKKWIYPLPQHAIGEGPCKHFILIAEDMHLLSEKNNKKAWKSKMNPNLLTSVYIIISENRMTDSIRIFNIPFSSDGRIAFIDTEYHNIPEEYASVRFWKLYDYLSSEMRNYLKGLQENGPAF